MSQKNYIQDVDVPDTESIIPNQSFYFSGFLFYVDGWDWDNITVNSNLQYEGVKENLSDQVSNFSSNPFQAIRDIKNNSSPLLLETQSFDVGDSLYFPELYTVAATCRRFQIYNNWRQKYNDITSPGFFESYSETIPTKTPLQDGDLTWSLWAGDIQAFTNLPGGRLEIGSLLYIKKLSLQKYTPVSITNSSKDIKIDRGYGEISGNNITNYYNPINSYIDELSTVKNGWYGVITLDSTPYTLEGGRGINFDTFIKVESNKVVGFHEDYPQNNISEYGKKRKQYIDS